MALNKTLKDYIKTIFYTNGNEEITGQTSQDGLVNLIDTLGASECKGVAVPTTNPGTAINGTAQWYFAVTPGYYNHFGFSVLANQICRLYYNHGTNSWVKEVIATLSSGGGSSVITYTVAELQTAIDNEALVAGALYVITDADTDLYGGTEIYLQAISATELNTEGIAKVLVPKYESIDIWISGGTYTAEDHVAWGGNVWENKTGAAGTATDIFTLDATNWELVAFNETDYRVVSPVIRYDILHDKILYMGEKNTVEVSMTLQTLEWATTNNYNPIKATKWGYCDSDIFDTTFSDIRITDSYFESINLFPLTLKNIYLSNRALVYNVNFKGNTRVNKLIIDDSLFYDSIVNNTFFEDIIISNNSTLSGYDLSGSTFRDIRFYTSLSTITSTAGSSMSGFTCNRGVLTFECVGSTLEDWHINGSAIIDHIITSKALNHVVFDYINFGGLSTETTIQSDSHYLRTLPTATTYDTILVKDGDEVKEIEVGDLGITSDLVNDTTPQLGGNLDLNGKCIDYGAILSTNGAYQGDIKTVTVDTNGVGFGALLAQGTDFHFDEADADAAANCYALVMALETGTGSKKVLLKGEICNTDWNWSAGFIYASTTQGTLTQTKPTGTDDVNVIVGWSLSADTMWFAPYSYYQEHV